jgi:Tfp pilus assembly protein PilV
MKLISGDRPAMRPTLRSGLTILEMLVATTLLVVIVLGLTAMFLQVQKAFRGGFTQSDVMESGRTVMGMLTRDFEQMADAKDGNITNMFQGWFATPLTQTDASGSRENVFSDLFTLEHVNNTWYGVGYSVSNAVGSGANSPQGLVGTLYRYVYQTNDIPSENPCRIFRDYMDNGNFDTNVFSRVIDGVIHLRMRAFDAYGSELTNSSGASVWLPITNDLRTPYYWDNPTNRPPNLPNSVELELGILEPQVVEQLRAFGTNMVAQSNFLSGRIGAVHIFRQQIPIRAALPR